MIFTNTSPTSTSNTHLGTSLPGLPLLTTNDFCVLKPALRSILNARRPPAILRNEEQKACIFPRNIGSFPNEGKSPLDKPRFVVRVTMCISHKVHIRQGG